MKAEILSIGTELLLGQIDNSDAFYLAGQLPLLGIDLYWVSIVGDNRGRLKEALGRAWDRSDIILTTGGLGPTQGDLTREMIAEFLGEKLEVAPELIDKVSAFFKSRGLEMPANNMKQATLITSARPMFNPLGTAPGWWIEKDGHVLATLPGPPHEMQLMWENEVLPRLQKRVGAVIFSRTIKTFGLGESKIDEMLSGFLGSDNPTLATYAKADGIQLRITAKAGDLAEARSAVERREVEIRALLKDYIWGRDNDTIEGVVGEELLKRGLSLATVESYTCGSLAAMLSGVDGSSRYFRGGIVVNSDEARVAFGVRPPDSCATDTGAASAEEMARVVRGLLKADIGVAIAGAAECGDKHSDNVYIAIDDGTRRRSLARNYPSYLRLAKQRAAYATLFELKKFLLAGG